MRKSHPVGWLFACEAGGEGENGEDATATRVGNGNMSLPQVGEGGPLAVDEDAPQGDTKRLQQGKKANHTVLPRQSIFDHQQSILIRLASKTPSPPWRRPRYTVLFGDSHCIFDVVAIAFSSTAYGGALLAAARSRSGSDNRPGCHSLPSRRFATRREPHIFVPP